MICFSNSFVFVENLLFQTVVCALLIVFVIMALFTSLCRNRKSQHITSQMKTILWKAAAESTHEFIATDIDKKDRIDNTEISNIYEQYYDFFKKNDVEFYQHLKRVNLLDSRNCIKKEDIDTAAKEFITFFHSHNGMLMYSNYKDAFTV